MNHSPLESALKYRLHLPPAPASEQGPVKAWQDHVTIFSFLPERPDPNPMFLEKRVYQGSSGKVYPMPFVDRIATEGKDHEWQAVHLENEFLRIMVLPEIGGRIHIGLDKINGYDFFYRQNVIKPALVGLAGPWISGGVEFNWPQHHRPATFLPVHVELERSDDGSVTIWCSDHDPLTRMKGMHGICLHPGRAYVELKVRLYNRTPLQQTFLWWANAAVRVHEQYQSFFPADVHYVADHAKRAISRFPLAEESYYGVDYAERARLGVPLEEQPRLYRPDGSYAANDLSWYANIPVPTSYMVADTASDFFGGYDHAARAGVVHVADHHIAPGKKQWTWGNHEFGYAWDRNLTIDDGPYVELMAGVYTDNQPDFSFLAPWETKTFSQFWYPIRQIGVPKAANLDAALSVEVEDGTLRAAACVTRTTRALKLQIRRGAEVLAEALRDLEVSDTFELRLALPAGVSPHEVEVVLQAGGRQMLRYAPVEEDTKAAAPSPAEELALPEQMTSLEELYLAGRHLEQYRHATRKPEIYWQEALRRDPSDARCNQALGNWHLRRGEFSLAEACARKACATLTRLNPNPEVGDCFYLLGDALRRQGKMEPAYSAFAKATWNFANRPAAHLALAEIEMSRHAWRAALGHLQTALRLNQDNLQALSLQAIALRRLGDAAEAECVLAGAARLDPLDITIRYLRTGQGPRDNQERLDIAFDFARAGLGSEAAEVLERADMDAMDGSMPIVLYTLAWLSLQSGSVAAANTWWLKARRAPAAYCFPARLDEIQVLQAALHAEPADARANLYLGNLLYDRGRHAEAIAHWQQAASSEPALATAWRNLGVGYYNFYADAERALDAYDRAFRASPADARILYERDQLWKRTGRSPEQRLAELQEHSSLIEVRDDLATELASLYNRLERPEDARALLASRNFQPWEGGEGLVLGQWTQSNLLLGRRALLAGDAERALQCFQDALAAPANLGEARHLLANQSETFFWMGAALQQMGRPQEAASWWRRAAASGRDFQAMRVQPVSELTYWSGRALLALDQKSRAEDLFRGILHYADELERQPAQVEYFATSLPTMLLFDEDLASSQRAAALFLRAQALLGLGEHEESAALLRQLLELNINHPTAATFLQAALHGETQQTGGAAW